MTLEGFIFLLMEFKGLEVFLLILQINIFWESQKDSIKRCNTGIQRI